MVYESVACNIISIHFLRISNISWKDCRYETLPSAAKVFVLAKFLGPHASCGKQNFSISTASSSWILLCWSVRGLRGLITRFDLVSVRTSFHRTVLLFYDICFWKLFNGSLLVWRAEWNINVWFCLAQWDGECGCYRPVLFWDRMHRKESQWII